MGYDADCFIRHIRACNNAALPGGRTRLMIGGAPVGWVAPALAPLGPLGDRGAFEGYAAGLARAGAFRSRGEAFDVRDDGTGAVVATVDRGAVPLLGIGARGVHLNGLVRRTDGLHLWVGRRAPDKRVDPDKLDHLTAGGIAAGHDERSTLLKEGAEEANLPDWLVGKAVAAGALRYAMERDERREAEGGLRRDLLYCFDLDVPESFVPRPNDGEVVGFTLLPLGEVMRLVAQTDEFKFNVNLVLVDLFLRLGMIAADGSVAAAMRPIRAEPIRSAPP